jgi:hypothetical protein
MSLNGTQRAVNLFYFMVNFFNFFSEFIKPISIAKTHDDHAHEEVK